MYLPPAEVQLLLQRCHQRFPQALLMFDHIPQWLSAKTLRGWQRTAHWRAPPMPWGVNSDVLAPLMRSWLPDARLQHWRFGDAPLPISTQTMLWRLSGLLQGVRARLPGIATLQWG
jgi:hypothetical protein